MPSQVQTLQLVIYPDPTLRKVSAPVTSFGPDLLQFVDQMFDLMRAQRGVGLAAPQVGRAIRLFVCNATGQPGDELVCINPKFVELSGSVEQDEGCLSIPGVTVMVRRAERVLLEAYDQQGRPFQMAADGLKARVWQHETDHLDGRLIVDRMSPTDDIANRRAIKQLEKEYAGHMKRRKKSG